MMVQQITMMKKMLLLGAEECSDGPHSDRSTMCVYLQNEDEVVDGFSALVNVVLRRALVALIEFEFLDDVGVPEDPQQDFLCDQERAEKADLCGGGVTESRGQSSTARLQNGCLF